MRRFLFLLLLLVPAVGRCCSVPVFRYALERWDPSPYELLVVSRGALNAAQEALVKELHVQVTNLQANVEIRRVDLDAAAPGDLAEILKAHTPNPLPGLLLVYPGRGGVTPVAWSGSLDSATVKAVFDSPTRREIVRLLTQGRSAVWVLLESGNASRDEAAATLLRKELDRLGNSLELPAIAEEDVAGGKAEAVRAQLKPSFGLLRIKRSDAAEKVFIQMLLGSEEDLAESKDPMAFPVFGRGRLLFALMGDGINSENVEDGCTFLVGPCSCVVKEQNPGIDLLIAAKWDSLLQERLVADPEIGELTSLSSVTAATNVALTPVVQRSVTNEPPGIPSRDRTLQRSLLLLSGIGALLLIGGTVALLRRR